MRSLPKTLCAALTAALCCWAGPTVVAQDTAVSKQAKARLEFKKLEESMQSLQVQLAESAPDESRILELAGTRAAIRPEHCVEAARAGDTFARAAVEAWLDALAEGLESLVTVVEPRRIVLGTIAVAMGEALCFEPLRRRLTARLWPHQQDRVEIVPAELGDRMPQYAGLAVAVGTGGASG